MTETLDLAGFRAAFPVCQSFHTGRWGWRRVNGCVNLNTCVWKTEAEAEADRDRHYDDYRKHPEDFSR